MATNYVQKGDRLTAPAPSGGAVSGTAYLLGALFGVCETSAAEGVDTVFVLVGVWSLPKASGTVTVGANLYWDNTAKNLTTTASGNTLVGQAFAAAQSGDAVVSVKIG